MDHSSWQFSVWRGAWRYALAVTLDNGEMLPWYSEYARLAFLDSRIHIDESTTRLPEVKHYFSGTDD